MKTITFRPLRRVKKTGKIVVASYMQWRKVKTADYGKFNLVIDEEYKTFPPDANVHNHNGEVLFCFKEQEPDDFYCAKGVDIDGVPCFSHYSAEYIASHFDVDVFEPLTVDTVIRTFGFFLYRLQNSYLQIK